VRSGLQTEFAAPVIPENPGKQGSHVFGTEKHIALLSSSQFGAEVQMAVFNATVAALATAATAEASWDRNAIEIRLPTAVCISASG